MNRRAYTIAALVATAATLGGCAPSTMRAPREPADLPAASHPTEDAGDLAQGDTPPQATDSGAGAEALPGSDPVSDSPLDELADIEPAPSEEALAEERARVAAEPPAFDIPMEVNDRVLAWVDLYSGPMRGSFEAALERSGRYLEMFRAIFREAGLPEDLVFMAHVESGYKTTAYSRAHARGIFQFIAATARRYGLRVDYWVDERADPEKSARAAADYMKDLYAEFGEWNLALAAYNAGEGKIRRALARSEGTDFWSIARTPHLRRETKNHVPAILAAALMSKDPERYGLTAERQPALVYDTVPVEGAADLRVLARCAGAEMALLRELNPALRRLQTPPDGVTSVRVPRGSGEATVAALQAIPAGERVLYARHRVRQGETLSSIGDHYGVEVAAIQTANHLGRSTLIRVNQLLLVPTSSASRFADPDGSEVAAVEDFPRAELVEHRVSRGETLSSVARRYGTTPDAIAAASGISVAKTLHVGERLTVARGIGDAALARGIAGRDDVVAGTRPAPQQTHTVQQGDTLWRIAHQYRTSVGALCALNAISPSTILLPGTRLTVRAQ